MKKEEKSIKIKTIATNSDEILNTLSQIENEQNKTILPYYDFIIEMLLAGETFTSKSVLKYFKFYCETFKYDAELLSDAIKALKYSYIVTEKLRLKWYQRLWFRILCLFKRR